MPDYKVPVITGSELVVGDLLRWDGSNWVNYPDSNYAGSPILAGLTVTGNSVLGLNSAVFQPTADATGFFQVKDQDGNAFITGDSVANTLIANGAIINGTIATGLDMSGGTFADYSIALPTDPKMSAGGTQFMYVDDTAKNFGLGRDIFSAITIGTYNMCLGDAAGTSITEANYCFLAGARAGAKITTADSCVGIGTNALFEKISGNAVVAIGNNAAYSVTTTGNIIAIGPNAARYHTNGNMTAIGVSAAESHEGYYNVMVGQQAGMHGTGSYGTYVGHQAGYSSDTSAPYGDADAITAIGAFAGTGISTADNCTYIGAYAGRYQTTIGNRVIVDGLDRTNAANEITDTLMYGILAATPASQSLRVNAGTFILGNPTHSDADDGGAVIQSFIREDGAGTASTAATITGSHDGTGANDTKGKLVFATDSGAGLATALTIDSAQNTKIGDGGTTNYTNVSATGVLTLEGTARRWQSQDLKPGYIKHPAASPPDSVEYQNRTFDAYDDTAEEQVFYIWHLPNNYAAGTASVRGHFGGMVSNEAGAEYVAMGFEYWHFEVGETYDTSGAADGGGSVNITIANAEGNYVWHESGTGVVDTTGWTNGITVFRFFRDVDGTYTGGDGEAEDDDYTGDALIGVYHLEYLRDSLGSS